MHWKLAAAALLSSMIASPVQSVVMPRPGAPVHARNVVRVAQSTCWYVVLYCKPSKRAVENWSSANGGEVIDTSSDEFPNFSRGYFCAVVGPLKSRSAAQAEAKHWQAGAAPDAYVKDPGSGC